jgi:signal transduction histidine kinase
VGHVFRALVPAERPSAVECERFSRVVDRGASQFAEAYQNAIERRDVGMRSFERALDSLTQVLLLEGPFDEPEVSRGLGVALEALRDVEGVDGLALTLFDRASGEAIVSHKVGTVRSAGGGASEPAWASVSVPGAEGLDGALEVLGRGGLAVGDGARTRFVDAMARVVGRFEQAWATRALRRSIATLEAERELRERFVAIVAHDLRGPLATAKLGSQLLLRGGGANTGRPEVLERIVKNLERMDTMLRDMLDVSRMNAGERMPLHLEYCDIVALVREVLADLATAHGDRFDLKGVPTLFGWWSPAELRRALWNLGVNAARYGDPAERISIRVEQEGDSVRLRVHNRGAPIAVADRLSLFDGFRRGSVAPSPDGAWGLGLALVRACAEAHGGKAEVTSDDTAGTVFSLRLPIDARRFQQEHAEAP